MELALQEAIDDQRQFLTENLDILLASAAESTAGIWGKPDVLDDALIDLMNAIPGCSQIYAVDCKGIQISSSILRDFIVNKMRGENLSNRPYIQAMTEDTEFLLSEVYLDRSDHSPCLTALQKVVRRDGEVMGCLAADFELLNLPDLPSIKSCGFEWRQIKGDPAIRRNLFQQEHVPSTMDNNIDAVHDIMADLLIRRGIFHAKLHYSSSRATLWVYKDPHRYRLHVLDEIIDPAVCLAYAKSAYPQEAVVSPDMIKQVLEKFRMLRNMDDTIYLRSGSINIINGIVGLTFSCDGSHYMSVPSFLSKGDSFWAVK